MGTKPGLAPVPADWGKRKYEREYARDHNGEMMPVCASSVQMWDAILHNDRHGSSALRKCDYCGRINQYDDRTSCPGCGAPIDPEQGDHR